MTYVTTKNILSIDTCRARYQEPVMEEGFSAIVLINFVPNFTNYDESESQNRMKLYSSYLLEKWQQLSVVGVNMSVGVINKSCNDEKMYLIVAKYLHLPLLCTSILLISNPYYYTISKVVAHCVAGKGNSQQTLLVQNNSPELGH